MLEKVRVNTRHTRMRAHEARDRQKEGEEGREREKGGRGKEWREERRGRAVGSRSYKMIPERGENYYFTWFCFRK